MKFSKSLFGFTLLTLIIAGLPSSSFAEELRVTKKAPTEEEFKTALFGSATEMTNDSMCMHAQLADTFSVHGGKPNPDYESAKIMGRAASLFCQQAAIKFGISYFNAEANQAICAPGAMQKEVATLKASAKAFSLGHADFSGDMDAAQTYADGALEMSKTACPKLAATKEKKLPAELANITGPASEESGYGHSLMDQDVTTLEIRNGKFE